MSGVDGAWNLWHLALARGGGNVEESRHLAIVAGVCHGEDQEALPPTWSALGCA